MNKEKGDVSMIESENGGTVLRQHYHVVLHWRLVVILFGKLLWVPWCHDRTVSVQKRTICSFHLLCTCTLLQVYILTTEAANTYRLLSSL